MDEVVNKLAHELANVIAEVVGDDPQVEACHEKARAAGFEMKVTLEAVVGFVNKSKEPAKESPIVKVETAPLSTLSWQAMSAKDKRYLRQLRIATDEPKKEEVE